MNWTQYSKYLDVKIADAHYVLEYSKKKYLEAKAQHEASLREKKAFEEGLEDLLKRKDDHGI